MAAGGKIKKTKVYAGSGNSGQRVEKQARKAGVDQWEEKTAKEKRQYVMPQSAPALQPQPTKQTAPRVPQGPVTKAQDDQTRALVNGTVRAAPQGAITKSQADAAIEVLLAPTRKSAFPSAGLNTQRGVTDRFLKPPSGTERADAFIKVLGGAVGDLMTAGDAAVNITGAGARERMAAQEEAASRSRSLQEAARKAALTGNTQALQAVQKQQEADMQTMGGGTLLDFLWGKLGNNSENDVSRNLRQQKEEAIGTLTQGLTPGESALANIGLQGANMLVNQAVAAAMGLPLPVYNAITQGGAAGQEALDQGYSPEQAAGLAAGSGAISYGIEKMGGVAGDWGDTLLKKAAGTKVGQALLSKVPQKVMDFLGSVSKNKAAQVLGTGLEEGFENFTEYDLQRLWRNLMLDESTPYDIRQAMSEAASGVLFGSVMAGVPALSDAARTKYGDWQEGRAWKQEDWGRLLEEASRSENPAVRQDAADIVSRMSQGKDPSAADLGALARRGRASGKIEIPFVKSTYQNSEGIVPFTEREVQNLSSKKGKVNGADSSFEDFIKDNSQKSEQNMRFYFGKVGPELAEDILYKTGLDLENYTVFINDSEIRHILNGHQDKKGRSGKREISISEDVLTKLPTVFDNPDRIELLGTTDYAGRQAIRMEKRINGIAIVITGVSNGRNALAVDSFWINKIKEGHPDTANSAGKSAPDPTSETRTGEVLPETSIPQTGENSNPQNLPNNPVETLLNVSKPEISKEDAEILLRPMQENEAARKRFVEKLAQQIIVNKDGWTQADVEEARRIRAGEPDPFSRPAAPATAAETETEAVDTLLNPVQERETERKRLADTLAQQIIVNKDGWTQADLEEARRVRGENADASNGTPTEETPSVIKNASGAQAEEQARRLQVLKEAEQARNPGPGDPGEPVQRGPRTPEERAEVNEVLNSTEPPVDSSMLTKEARQAQNRFYNALRQEMPIPTNKEGRNEVKKALEPIVREISETGTVFQDTVDRAFDTLYENLRVMNTDWYDQYKGLKKELRDSRMYLSDTDRADISDFEAFRKANMGNFTITKDSSAISVNQKYQELSQAYPELFPSDITHPADQVRRMSEVSKSIAKQEVDVDTYYGEDAAAFREYVRDQFDDALNQLVDDLLKVRKVQDPGTIPAENSGVTPEQDYTENTEFLNRVDKGLVDDPSTEDLLIDAYNQAWKLEAAAHKYDDLSKEEQKFVNSLLEGTNTPKEVRAKIGDEDSYQRVVETAEAKKQLEEAIKPIREYNAKRLNRMEEDAKLFTANMDLWKDKATGFQYQRETMERNLRDIIPNKREAEKVIDHYFTPVHTHEAERTRFLETYRERVRNLGLNTQEARWVQLVGEGVKDIKDLPLGVDPIKISRAVTELRDRIYPELYQQVAETLVRNGYEPPGRLTNYFPHFSDPDDPMTNLLKAVGIEVNLKELPTAIAGKTETFEPGKRWFGNILHRDGRKTEYNALEGFDRYIEGASQLIYHTEDIQKLRVLEKVIRERYDNTDGKKDLLNSLTQEQLENDLYKDWDAEKLLGGDVSRLSKFVTELHSYTNTLAGKKVLGDRIAEHRFGRAIYSVTKSLENRVASNMIALNPGAWINNLIPLTQGGAEVSTRNFLKAMWQTMKNYIKSDDGFVDRSTFLTNRRGSQSVSRSGLRKATDAMSAPMEAVDMFTSNVLTRSRYLDNLDAGMGETQAMREADKWTAGVMADRSLGALPTLFQEKNARTKLVTMFQVETNNQLSHLFKDLPQEAKKKGLAWTAKTALEISIASWLYNELYEKLTGRRPAVDPIGIALDFGEDLADENTSTADAVGNLGENLLENVPFTTALNLVGIDAGGRYPVQAAIPDFYKMGVAASGLLDGTMAPNAAGERIGKELAKLGYYLLPPAGGGAAKKYVEGMDAVLNGGVYSTNKKGGEDLLYPVDSSNPLEVFQAVLFGKSATPGGREYYRNFEPVEPQTQEQKNEAKTRSLPRLLNYSYGEDENRVEGSVMLSGKEQKAYQDAFAALLPENMESLSPEMQKQVYQYAEQIARDSALAGRGVEEYSPSAWVQKAQKAAESGIGVDNFLKLKEQLSALEPIKDPNGKTTETAAQQKRNTLFENEELTPEQKQTIDLLLISGGDSGKVSDYTNNNAYLRSQMNETEQARYDAAAGLFSGMTAEEYRELAKLAKSQKAGEETGTEKKQAVLQALMDRGMNRREAYAFYALAKAANPGETNWTDVEGACYAGLSDSGKNKYQAVREYFVELPVSDFAYIQDILSGVEGDRDQSGKTVSGSLKRNKLAVLMGLGMTAAEAQVYYNLTK